MQVVTHVPPSSAQLGGCYTCKADQRHDPISNELEPMIDWGIEMEISVSPDDLDAIFREGADKNSLVICRSCILEAAALFGATPPEVAARVQADLEAVTGEYLELESRYQAATDYIKGALGSEPAAPPTPAKAAFKK